MRPEVIQGDALTILKTLDSESVQCVVTSPPYWGLRDYGVEGQAGLEETPEEFIANLVKVFREVKRVLRDDGTVWLNLGDTYWGGGGGNYMTHTTFKPKDIVGIPFRVAFALQEDGWWLRQDIVWNKPNPMPESVVDRCTKSHEYIFLLTKSKKYYYDNEAIKEPVTGNSHDGRKDSRLSPNSFYEIEEGSFNNRKGTWKHTYLPTRRNKRSVWKIGTKPYSEAHFATFPEELPETCIKVATKIGDTVLDIFAGSGTTLRAASRLGRKGIGIELNPEYIKILKKRCKIESESLESFV